MRKLFVFNRITLDGYFAGPDGEIDWFVQDPQVDAAAHALMRPDTTLFGRVTYQMFEQFWPHAAGDPNAPEGVRAMGRELTEMTKLVFSKTLKTAGWRNTRLDASDPAAAVKKLKQGSGADIVVFGSGSIVQQLAAAGLVDTYALVVSPVVLGKGRALFEGVPTARLALAESQAFGSGNVLMVYHPA